MTAVVAPPSLATSRHRWSGRGLSDGYRLSKLRQSSSLTTRTSSAGSGCSQPTMTVEALTQSKCGGACFGLTPYPSELAEFSAQRLALGVTEKVACTLDLLASRRGLRGEHGGLRSGCRGLLAAHPGNSRRKTGRQRALGACPAIHQRTCSGLPHRGHRQPVVDDGDTNATGRSVKPHALQRSVRTRICVRTRIVRVRVAITGLACPWEHAARARSLRPSSTRRSYVRRAAPSTLPWQQMRSSCGKLSCRGSFT